MEDNKIKNDISLKIKKRINNRDVFVRRQVNNSLLSYEYIVNQIYDVISKDKIDSDNFKISEIYLFSKNEKIKKIIIYDEEEWNFLYNYNIINECINKNNELKIDYKIYSKDDLIDENIKANNSTKIFSYILENLPYEYYINSLFNFFLENKNIVELFKIFLIKNLIKTNLKDIKNNLNNNIKNNDLLKKNNNSNSKFENKEKYLIDNEEFFNIFRNNINQISKKNNCLKDIKNIIYNKDEKEFENTLEKKTNNTSLNLNANRKIYENIENIFIYQTSLNLKNENKNILDENNIFKKFNNEEFNTGIETLKDNLYHIYISNNNIK